MSLFKDDNFVPQKKNPPIQVGASILIEAPKALRFLGRWVDFSGWGNPGIF